MTNTTPYHADLQAVPERTSNWAYWMCQLGGWGVVLLLDSSVALVSAGSLLPNMAAIVATTGVAGVLISDAWHRILKKNQWLLPGTHQPWLRIITGVVICAALQLTCVWTAFQIFFPARPNGDLSWMPSAVLIWLSVFAIWTTFYAAILKLRKARRLEIERLELELLMKEANLRALETQVNPHFFFNSLNSIRALIYQDTDAAAAMIERLASMMRYTLQDQNVRTVTLGTELDAVRNYLEIERIRFEERLCVEESVDADVTGMHVPPMMLQTLVENAIKYGMERTPGRCTIRIEARANNKTLTISIANQGRLATSGSGTRVGLENAAKRLSLLFGSKATIDLSERDGWVIAQVAVPEMAT